MVLPTDISITNLLDRPTIKHAADFLKFQTHSKPDFDKSQAYCLQQQIQFASSPHPQTRPLKVALRRLLLGTSIQDIHIELIASGYPVLTVSQLYGEDRTTNSKILYPLFLVTLKKKKKNLLRLFFSSSTSSTMLFLLNPTGHLLSYNVSNISA